MAFAHTGFVAWPNTPTRRTDGSISRNRSTPFAVSTEAIRDTPVMFPPGCAKLGTMPVSTGSPAIMTIGMSCVACFAASAGGGVERHDHIDVEPDQLGRELRKAIQLFF